MTRGQLTIWTIDVDFYMSFNNADIKSTILFLNRCEENVRIDNKDGMLCAWRRTINNSYRIETAALSNPQTLYLTLLFLLVLY
jgi:hypothetical protein